MSLSRYSVMFSPLVGKFLKSSLTIDSILNVRPVQTIPTQEANPEPIIPCLLLCKKAELKVLIHQHPHTLYSILDSLILRLR